MTGSQRLPAVWKEPHNTFERGMRENIPEVTALSKGIYLFKVSAPSARSLESTRMPTNTACTHQYMWPEC